LEGIYMLYALAALAGTMFGIGATAWYFVPKLRTLKFERDRERRWRQEEDQAVDLYEGTAYPSRDGMLASIGRQKKREEDARRIEGNDTRH
jgi:hypothetical protein